MSVLMAPKEKMALLIISSSNLVLVPTPKEKMALLTSPSLVGALNHQRHILGESS